MASEKGVIAPASPLPWPRPGRAYKVQDGDDWGSVARKLNVTVDALIRHNCGTREPKVVNWYLREKVGCRRKTVDKWNYIFHSTANPGYVYAPVIDLPEVTVTGEAWPEARFRLVGTMATVGKKLITGGILRAQLHVKFTDSDDLWGWPPFWSLVVGLELSVLPADSEEFLTHWSSPVAYRYPKVDLRKYWTTVYPWVTLNFSSVGGKYQVGYSVVAMTLKFAVPNEPSAIRGNGKNPYHISKTIRVKQSTSTLPNPSLSNVSAESGNLSSFGVIKSGGAKRK